MLIAVDIQQDQSLDGILLLSNEDEWLQRQISKVLLKQQCKNFSMDVLFVQTIGARQRKPAKKRIVVNDIAGVSTSLVQRNKQVELGKFGGLVKNLNFFTISVYSRKRSHNKNWIMLRYTKIECKNSPLLLNR